jgi:HPt (histidine-containing phosphotransfer) domain-containing protein
MNEPKKDAPIVSEFAGDPDMLDLVEWFVSQIPERVEQLQESFERGSLDELGTLAHQLKGAGGSYGFPQITESARRLEHQTKVSDVDEVRRGLDELVDLCNRVSL